MEWEFGYLVRCILGVATICLHLVSYVSATPGVIVSPRGLLDPISLPIHVLENLKRSPADNTTFGAGIGVVGLSTDRQCVLFLIHWNSIANLGLLGHITPSFRLAASTIELLLIRLRRIYGWFPPPV